MPDLDDALEEIARSAVLLVATDYDGTLAPIVKDPALASAGEESIAALGSLASLPSTHVAVISGRSLSDLASHLSMAAKVHLVGSHGMEFDGGFATPVFPADLERLARGTAIARSIVDRTPGTVLELKPTGFAFHYRNADQAAADAAVAELLATVQELNELHIRHGKKVIELSVVNMNKGQALLRLRRTLEATAVIFLGDDLTDEDVFTMLGPGDLGIKVGEGPTAAAHRVADTGAVGRLLARASALRRAWTAREGLARPESRI